MGIFKLIARNVLRHKLRSLLTIFGIAVAILAFGLLRTIVDAYFMGVEASSNTRLITRNAVSLVVSLPLAYQQKIADVPGVTGVSYGNWFGGTYIDERNFFPQFAVEPESFLALYPELLLSEQETKDFLSQRNSCIVGATLATRYGWEVGDTFRLIGTIYPGNWDFVIRGIYHGAEKATDEASMYFNWSYLDESLRQTAPPRAGQIGIFYIGIETAAGVVEISQAIDRLFDNSLAETKTESEKEFQLGFISMLGTIITSVRIISMVVIVIILMVLANTMAMTARERIAEYAVLKTLGFRPKHIAGLIFGESAIMALLGGTLGIGITLWMIRLFDVILTQNFGSFFPVFEITRLTLALSIVAAVVVGLAAAVFPTVQAIRIRVAEGLRRVG